jgi:hypothetical protein
VNGRGNERSHNSTKKKIFARFLHKFVSTDAQNNLDHQPRSVSRLAAIKICIRIDEFNWSARDQRIYVLKTAIPAKPISMKRRKLSARIVRWYRADVPDLPSYQARGRRSFPADLQDACAGPVAPPPAQIFYGRSLLGALGEVSSSSTGLTCHSKFSSG